MNDTFLFYGIPLSASFVGGLILGGFFGLRSGSEDETTAWIVIAAIILVLCLLGIPFTSSSVAPFSTALGIPGSIAAIIGLFGGWAIKSRAQ